MCARLDFENWIQITQKEIAENLEMKRQVKCIQKYLTGRRKMNTLI